MEQLIAELKVQVEKLEKECALIKRKDYESQTHKTFVVGDWVTDGKDIGVVGWVENKGLGIRESDGYFGLDIKNGNLGFCAPCKRDAFKLLAAPQRRYFTEKQTIEIRLTGEEIERVLYALSCQNKVPALNDILIEIRNDYR